MTAKFSIVTPSFNQFEWLKLCAASVADQAGVQVEHIVQDAGTGEALDSWAQSQPALRLFVEKDAGMYDAINRGLRRSTGGPSDICAYLNCDEQFLPGTLERVGRCFANDPEADVVFGDAILVDGRGEALSYRRVVRPTAIHTRLVHLSTLSCAMFFRKRVVDEGFLFPSQYQMIGDAVFVWNLLIAKKKMIVLHEPISVFTFTGENIGQSQIAKQEAEIWRKGPGAPWSGFKIPAILVHRLQKFAAGAYRFRNLNYSIYTSESSTKRSEFKSRCVGWKWPAKKIIHSTGS